MTALAPRPTRTLGPPRVTGKVSDHWIVRSLICAALAAAAAVMLAQVLNSLSVRQPLPDLMAAINAGDAAVVAETLGGDSDEWLARADWLMATDAYLTLNGCRANRDNSTTCQVHFGPAWFYNRAAPPAFTAAGSFATEITVETFDRHLLIREWPLPAGLAVVDKPFRLWAMQVHPQEAQVMWEPLHPARGVSTSMRVDGAAGAARLSLLDEYLTYRDPPAL